jgi:hypothetical protein
VVDSEAGLAVAAALEDLVEGCRVEAGPAAAGDGAR